MNKKKVSGKPIVYCEECRLSPIRANPLEDFGIRAAEKRISLAGATMAVCDLHYAALLRRLKKAKNTRLDFEILEELT